MRSGDRFLQAAENLVECIAADLALAAGRQHEIAVRILADHILFRQPREERGQVDVLVDESALLQRAHPAHRLFDVAAGLQQQMIEETAQPHLSQHLPDQIGIEV